MDCVEKAITNYNSKENSIINCEDNKIQYAEIDNSSVNKNLTVNKSGAQTSDITDLTAYLFMHKTKNS